MDCGEGAQGRFVKFGLGLNREMLVLITHLHGDHVNGLLGLLQTMSMSQRVRTLTIVAPQELFGWLKATMEVLHIGLSFDLRSSPSGRGSSTGGRTSGSGPPGRTTPSRPGRSSSRRFPGPASSIGPRPTPSGCPRGRSGRACSGGGASSSGESGSTRARCWAQEAGEVGRLLGRHEANTTPRQVLLRRGPADLRLDLRREGRGQGRREEAQHRL